MRADARALVRNETCDIQVDGPAVQAAVFVSNTTPQDPAEQHEELQWDFGYPQGTFIGTSTPENYTLEDLPAGYNPSSIFECSDGRMSYLYSEGPQEYIPSPDQAFFQIDSILNQTPSDSNEILAYVGWPMNAALSSLNMPPCVDQQGRDDCITRLPLHNAQRRISGDTAVNLEVFTPVPDSAADSTARELAPNIGRLECTHDGCDKTFDNKHKRT